MCLRSTLLKVVRTNWGCGLEIEGILDKVQTLLRMEKIAA
jgi:hypothetical protein